MAKKKTTTAPPPSAAPPPDSPGFPIVPFKYTTFNVIGYLNAKNVAASFCKTEKQSWWNRRNDVGELQMERANKRRRLAGWGLGMEFAKGGIYAAVNGNGNVQSEESKDGEEKRKMALEEKKDGSDGRVLLSGKVSRTTKRLEERDKDKAQNEVIVIHPGSRFTRIGRSSDPYPLTIPTVIARRRRTSPTCPEVVEWDPIAFPKSEASSANNSEDEMEPEERDRDREDEGSRATSPFQEKVNALRGDLKAKMRSLKLRGQTNGQGLAKSHNSQVDKTVIQEINDYDRVEWTEGEPGEDGLIEKRDIWVGEQALLLAKPEEFSIRWPLSAGTFNTTNYRSPQELMGDLESFFVEVLRENWGIEKEELEDYSVILVVPDLNEQYYVVQMTDLLLKALGFSQIILQQESLCATFGAGLSTACVVDVGSKKTSISCVEEGLVLSETRNCLAFGGDDVTELFLKLLVKLDFPYKNVDLNNAYDWKMLEGLKEQICTLSETGYGLNLFEFAVRKFGRPTAKYALKVYEDAYIAPLALFSPRIIDFERKFEKQALRPKFWSSDKDLMDDMYDTGFNLETTSMRFCTRHLFPPISIPLNGSSTMPEMLDTGDVSMTLSAYEEGTSYPGSAGPNQLRIPSSAIGTPGGSTPARGTSPVPSASGEQNGIGGRRGIDVVREASKVPLDVALVECISAAGTAEERIKRLSSSILVVGGGVKVNGFANALTARLTPMIQSRYPSIANVSVIPPPREIDPCILAWKGVSVLNQLESAKELWVRKEEWEALGMKALRERTLFL